MKKILFIFALLAMKTNGFSQSNESETSVSTLEYISNQLAKIESGLNEFNRYKLYPTENIYNFLKLDTATGKIDQVQYTK